MLEQKGGCGEQQPAVTMTTNAISGEQASQPSLREQTRLLSDRSTLYRLPAPPKPDQAALAKRINQLYAKRPYSVVGRITAQFRREGLNINHKRI